MPDRADILLALVFVVVGQFDVWRPWGDEWPRGGFDGPSWVNAALVLAYTAPLAWRRRAPFAMLIVMVAAQLTQLVLVSATVLFFGELVPLVIITYSVAQYAGEGRAFVGLVVVVAALGIAATTDPGLISARDWVLDMLMLGVAWAVGRWLRLHRQRAADLAIHAEEVERERDEEVRAAVADERARIARELHDVVAHGVSVMGVQAGAARVLIERDPAGATSALLAVERMSREALAEMQRLVSILRGDSSTAALQPQPGLAELDALLDDVRGAGLPVKLIVEGEHRELPAGLELSAYRIIQEALTNTLKHAGPAQASVTLLYGADSLELLISDTGKGTGSGSGGGRGIPGMRERVAVYGGTLDAGPAHDGYRVAACLPFESLP